MASGDCDEALKTIVGRAAQNLGPVYSTEKALQAHRVSQLIRLGSNRCLP